MLRLRPKGYAAHEQIGSFVCSPRGRGILPLTNHGLEARATSKGTQAQLPHLKKGSYSNPIFTTDANGATTLFEYDGRNQLTRTVFPDGTEERFTYTVRHVPGGPPDGESLPISSLDREGRAIQLAYDAAARIANVTDALGRTWSFGYDEVGSRLSQTDDNGNTVQLGYDSRGREISRTLPDGLTQSRTYDAAGNLVSRTNYNGLTTTFSYDNTDRLVSRVQPDGASFFLTYTDSGQRASIQDVRGLTTYSYDANDRLANVTYPDTTDLTYSYDAAGNLTSLIATGGATTLTQTYTYDAQNRLATVTDNNGGSYTYSYDANGNLVSQRYPNGVATTYGYDPLDQLTSLVTADPLATVLESFSYTLDASGKRLRVDEADGTFRQHAYDGAGRLLSEAVSNAAGLLFRNQYSYDAVGNRLSQEQTQGTNPPVTEALSYDTRDRLVTAGSLAFTWDADGQLLTRSGAEGVTNVWDAEGRLLETTHADGTIVTHLYDFDGNRVQTTVTPLSGAPIVTKFLVNPQFVSAQGPRRTGLTLPPNANFGAEFSDEQPHVSRSGILSHVVAETDDTGTLLAHYVRGGDQLLAVLRPTGTRYYHSDGLGSIRQLTDETGSGTDSYDYTAFGELLGQVGTDPNPYQFAGEPLGPKGHFSYNRQRWLDPATGRFLSIDPFDGFINEPSTLHAYSYVSNDPVNNIDPSGEIVFTFAGLSISVTTQGKGRTVEATRGGEIVANVTTKLAKLGKNSVRKLKNQKARKNGKLEKLDDGKGDIWIHHIIEQRFWRKMISVSNQWPGHQDNIPGVPVSRGKHQEFTNAWRALFPYGKGIPDGTTLTDLIIDASKIYAEHPQIFHAIFGL